MPKKYVGLLLLLATVLASLFFLSQPQPAAAQCGSSTSSCRDCHEVKKQAPVNSKGAWHTGHAFGDLCESCHAGNAKAKDKTESHVGLTAPLGDVEANCAWCHGDETSARAQKYATLLGTTVGTGAKPAASPAAAVVAAGECGPAAPTGGQLIDLNLLYSEGLGTQPSGVGNWILLAMIGGTVVLLFGLVWHYESPLPRAVAAGRRLLATPYPSAAGAGDDASVALAAAGRPELGALLPLLQASDQQTLRALVHVLADRENGPRVLKALSNLDLRALGALGEGDEKTLAALLSLVKEMHS